MKTYKRNLKEEEFKRLFGVKKNIQTDAGNIRRGIQHKVSGKLSLPSVEDKLSIILQYLHEYRTMEHITCDWQVTNSRVFYAVQLVENTLIKDEILSFPEKKVLRKSDDTIKYIAVDANKSPIERHTVKTQTVINRNTRQIICAAQDKRHIHDFSLCKKLSA